MRNVVITAALAAALGAGFVRADDVEPAHDVSFNAAVTSDYRYRGMSQSRLAPALQGGADYMHHSSGLYAGLWLSTIHWVADAGGDGNVEWDVYGGKRGQITETLSYDVGVLAYVYPDNRFDRVPGAVSANTTELYGQIGAGPAYAKYSRSLTNLFGYAGSRGSAYLDLGANINATDALVINLHAGRQSVARLAAANYTDWKAGVTLAFAGVSGSLALVGTNASHALYSSSFSGKFLGRRALVASLSRTF